MFTHRSTVKTNIVLSELLEKRFPDLYLAPGPPNDPCETLFFHRRGSFYAEVLEEAVETNRLSASIKTIGLIL